MTTLGVCGRTKEDIEAITNERILKTILKGLKKIYCLAETKQIWSIVEISDKKSFENK